MKYTLHSSVKNKYANIIVLARCDETSITPEHYQLCSSFVVCTVTCILHLMYPICQWKFFFAPVSESRGREFESFKRLAFFSKTIRKTCPCNIYPLKPNFYIVKLGYAGVYLFFLFLLQNIYCWYSLEPPRRGGSNVYPQSMF